MAVHQLTNTTHTSNLYHTCKKITEPKPATPNLKPEATTMKTQITNSLPNSNQARSLPLKPVLSVPAMDFLHKAQSDSNSAAPATLLLCLTVPVAPNREPSPSCFAACSSSARNHHCPPRAVVPSPRTSPRSPLPYQPIQTAP
ncbi:hypothetical protein M0R45_005016 [Rubus argutus]|uniref:Uncharacterized protein n=1 Tax=Rubus argutus TaxID=59490 RepID=A0AAW1YLH9_RUBAR